MLNITSFTNFKNYPIKREKQTNTIKQNSFKFNGYNLKPLQKDTVSFSGVVEFKTAIDNAEICKQLHEDAKEAGSYLNSVFSKHFDEITYNKETKPYGIVDPIESRIKSAESIQEKIADKIDRALRSDNIKNDIFSPTSLEQIKVKLRDIPGIRIVMRKADDHHTDVLIDTLCKTIEQEDLIIDEIENHASLNENIKPYFKQEHLDKLKDTINKVRKINGLSPIEINTHEGKSGYMALHLDVNLQHIGKNAKNRGYHGELQIIGSDVSMLKDIEDLCYKLKQGKAIKAQHLAYTPFEKFFLNAWNDENYPNIKKDFETYTQRAYEHQRARIPSDDIFSDKKNWAYRYPTIEECGLKGKIPPILDFNILARIKRDCDDLYKIENNSQAILDSIKNEHPI